MTEPMDRFDPPLDEAAPVEMALDEAALGAGTPENAGQARVDAALAGIDAVSGRPPAEQVAAFGAAQQALQATLASIDEN